MQQSQSFAGFDYHSRFELHATAACDKQAQGFANSVMTCDWPATGNEHCAGLVEGEHRLDIAKVEGAFEESMNLLRR